MDGKSGDGFSLAVATTDSQLFPVSPASEACEQLDMTLLREDIKINYLTAFSSAK
jgi:hypothetical protein